MSLEIGFWFVASSEFVPGVFNRCMKSNLNGDTSLCLLGCCFLCFNNSTMVLQACDFLLAYQIAKMVTACLLPLAGDTMNKSDHFFLTHGLFLCCLEENYILEPVPVGNRQKEIGLLFDVICLRTTVGLVPVLCLMDLIFDTINLIVESEGIGAPLASIPALMCPSILASTYLCIISEFDFQLMHAALSF